MTFLVRLFLPTNRTQPSCLEIEDEEGICFQSDFIQAFDRDNKDALWWMWLTIDSEKVLLQASTTPLAGVQVYESQIEYRQASVIKTMCLNNTDNRPRWSIDGAIPSYLILPRPEWRQSYELDLWWNEE